MDRSYAVCSEKKKKQCRKEHNGYFDAYRMVGGIPTTKVSPGLEVGLGKGWLVVSINAGVEICCHLTRDLGKQRIFVVSRQSKGSDVEICI